MSTNLNKNCIMSSTIKKSYIIGKYTKNMQLHTQNILSSIYPVTFSVK